MNYHKALNEHPKTLPAWLTPVQSAIDKKDIHAEDIYNVDKTRFAMCLISSQGAVTKAEYFGRSSLRSQKFTNRSFKAYAQTAIRYRFI